MPNIGVPELVIILVIALLVLGPGRLPDVASSLGKSIREFRKAATDVQDSVKLDAPPAAPATPAPAAAAPVAAAAAAPAVPAPVAAEAAAPPTPAEPAAVNIVAPDSEPSAPASAPAAEAVAEPAAAEAAPAAANAETQA